MRFWLLKAGLLIQVISFALSNDVPLQPTSLETVPERYQARGIPDTPETIRRAILRLIVKIRETGDTSGSTGYSVFHPLNSIRIAAMRNLLPQPHFVRSAILNNIINNAPFDETKAESRIKSMPAFDLILTTTMTRVLKPGAIHSHLFSEVHRRIQANQLGKQIHERTVLPDYGCYIFSEELLETYRRMYPVLRNLEVKAVWSIEKLNEEIRSIADDGERAFVFRLRGHSFFLYVDGKSKSILSLNGLNIVETGYTTFSFKFSRQCSLFGCTGFALHDAVALMNFGPNNLIQFAQSLAMPLHGNIFGILVVPGEFMLTLQSMKMLHSYAQISRAIEQLMDSVTIERVLALRDNLGPLKNAGEFFNLAEKISQMTDKEKQTEALKQLLKVLKVTTHPDQPTPYQVVKETSELLGRNAREALDFATYLTDLMKQGLLEPVGNNQIKHG